MQRTLSVFPRILPVMVRWGALAVWFWLMIGAETCFADYMRDRPAGQMAGLLLFAAGMLVLLGTTLRKKRVAVEETAVE